MKHLLTVCLGLTLALTMAACSSSDPTSGGVTTPAAPTITDPFTGTVQPNFGVDFHPFTVSQVGPLTVTLTAAGPPSTILMGIGIGTPSASTCALTSSNTTIQPAGATAQLSFTSVAAGAYCVQVYDVGNALSPITYAVTVAHT